MVSEKEENKDILPKHFYLLIERKKIIVTLHCTARQLKLSFVPLVGHKSKIGRRMMFIILEAFDMSKNITWQERRNQRGIKCKT